jgi:hypothetical protein
MASDSQGDEGRSKSSSGGEPAGIEGDEPSEEELKESLHQAEVSWSPAT